MKILIQDIKRALSMGTFWIGVSVILASSFYTYRQGFECIHFVTMMRNYGFIGTLNRVIEALCNTNIGIPAVIAASISYGVVTCDEMRNGYLVNELTRTNPRKFIVFRIISTAVVGALIMVFVYVIWLGYAFVIDPNPSTQIMAQYGAIGIVYEKSLWSYLLLHFLQAILLTAFYSLLSMGVAIVSRNKYFGYVAPLLYFLGRDVLGTYLPRNLSFIYGMYPFDLISSIWESISSTIFVLPMSLVLIIIGFRQWREGKW